MTELKCKCCGATINPTTLTCEYCGTHYANDSNEGNVLIDAERIARAVAEFKLPSDDLMIITDGYSYNPSGGGGGVYGKDY